MVITAREGAGLVSRRPQMVAAKLATPVVPADHLRRPRLEHKLDAGIECGVVIVAAPPGYGKTTAVATWAHRRPRTAWVTLDPMDADPARYVSYALTAIAGAAPTSVSSALGALDPLPPMTPIDDAYLATAVNAISSTDQEIVLVLDDFQTIIGSPTEKLFQHLLSYRRQLKIVIITRADPAVGQHRLRLHGGLTDIRADELAFTADEARELIEGIGADVDDSSVTTVMRLSEGWPVAVQLLATTIRAHVSPADVESRLADDGQPLAEYLMAEVLDQQAPATRQLLKRVSLVNPIDAGLAQALSGIDDAGERLATLARANLFVSAVPGTTGQFRFHPMLGRMLSQLQAEEEPGLCRHLRGVASRWYAEAGRFADAADHAVEAGDGEFAAEQLGQCWFTLIWDNEHVRLRSLAEAIASLATDAAPELDVARAALAYIDGDRSRAEDLSRAALRGAAGLSPARQRRVETAAATMLLQLAALNGRNEQTATDIARRALLGSEHTPEASAADPRLRTALLVALGAFETIAGEPTNATAHLRQAVTDASRLDLDHLALTARALLALHDAMAGRVTPAQHEAQGLLEASGKRGWADYHANAAAHLTLALVDVIHGELDEVDEHLMLGEQVLRSGDKVGAFTIETLRDVVNRMRKDLPAGRASLQRLRSMRAGWPDAAAWVDVAVCTAEAEQRLMEGRPGEAAAIMAQAPDVHESPVLPRRALVLAVAALRQGQPADAQAGLRPVQHPDAPPHIRARALVLDAVAAEELGQRDVALTQLDLALTIAARDGLVWSFLDSAPNLGRLLEDLRCDRTQDTEFCDEILRRVRDAAVTEERPLVERLTGREAAVLRHLPGTLRNDEIAARLYVSVSTVKTHVNNINRKLGTANRREAVRRARELGLL